MTSGLNPGCCDTLLWGNTYLPPLGVAGQPGLKHRHTALLVCHALRTLGDVLSQETTVAAVAKRWGPTPTLGQPVLADWRCPGGRTLALQVVPLKMSRDWLAAAHEVHLQQATTWLVPLVDMIRLSPCMAWRVPGLDEPVLLSGLTIHFGTSMQQAAMARLLNPSWGVHT